MAFIYDLADTWNNGATTFTAIKMNVTDTASNAASLLMDLQTGGVSQFKVSKAGAVTTNAAVTVNGNVNVAGFTNSFNWGSVLTLVGDANNILAQRNGANAQLFRLYNTYTDASNYERAEYFWNSNIAGVALTNAGTGTARSTYRFVGAASADYQICAGTDNNSTVNFRHTGSASSGGSSVSYVGRLNGHRGFFDSGGTVTFAIPNGATDRWAFFGTTSSFPAIKRSTTSLQVRLADDSAFTNIQGKLTTDTAYTAGAVVATGYLTLFDSTGTAYRVPCLV